jgi:hypothetical protein
MITTTGERLTQSLPPSSRSAQSVTVATNAAKKDVTSVVSVMATTVGLLFGHVKSWVGREKHEKTQRRVRFAPSFSFRVSLCFLWRYCTPSALAVTRSQ